MQEERDEKTWWRGTRHSPRLLPIQKQYRFDPASKNFNLALPVIYAPTMRTKVNWGFGAPRVMEMMGADDDPIPTCDSLEEVEAGSKSKFGSGFSKKTIKSLQRDSKRYRELVLSLRLKLKQLKKAPQTAAVLRDIKGIERKALQLYAHDVRGMTTQEIADQLGGTRAAVSNAIDRLERKFQAEVETGQFFDDVMQDIGEMKQQVEQQKLAHEKIYGKRGLPADGHVSECKCGPCLRAEPNFKIDAVSVGRGLFDALGDITPKQAWRNRRASHPGEVSAGIVHQGFKPLRQTRFLVENGVLNERAAARKIKKDVRADAAAQIKTGRRRKLV
jgi:predicted transcriptional regulator